MIGGESSALNSEVKTLIADEEVMTHWIILNI